MIKDRVIQHIESKGISKNKFYKLTGIPNGTLDKKTGVSEMFIEKYISTFPEINLNWLITGKGEMLVSEKKEEEKTTGLGEIAECKKCKELEKEIDLLKQLIESKNETIKAYQSTKRDCQEQDKRNSA